MSDGSPILVWMLQDLRLDDHPALSAAAATRQPVLPVYVLDDEGPGPWALGGASRWWLHHSLTDLNAALEAAGTSLVLRRGAVAEQLVAAAQECGARQIYCTAAYEPAHRQMQEQLAEACRAAGIQLRRFLANVLYEPGSVTTGSDTQFKVFSPFHKACLREHMITPPVEAPQRLKAPETAPASDELASWRLLPTAPDWAGGFRETWVGAYAPGCQQADAQMQRFFEEGLSQYKEGRNFPAKPAVSRLSARLRFGEISIRRLYMEAQAQYIGDSKDLAHFLSELHWREFAIHLLAANPALPEDPLRAEFAQFPWDKNATGLDAWQRGQTGYPIVDAGMRELWHTGYMHNRVRMIVGSFLIKDLMIPWQDGEAWFWDTLVDADLANNSASWQWVAGCGTDAAPYFRIFNPVSQSQKFDPDGAYIRRWVPELAALSDKQIHAPWEVSPLELQAAGVRLGTDYPEPIVNHAHARDRALEAFQTIKKDAA